ncbi:hypothetical protein JTE90_001316 [Oedothorax gibbosus]|uniref:Fibrinogen C-terminal domain-containing protein n=1 Tax=Oedothorax gibbosus TaxID=931172 RepID=A0AAV6U463_9ARAC|nr:hypothetical protein JTE90_001316 [Oedothorax gibbosus]
MWCLNIRKDLWTLLCVLLAVNYAYGNVTSICGNSGKSISYLEIATDMIAKVKDNYPICSSTNSVNSSRPVDCEEVLRRGQKQSGVYTVWPRSRIIGDRSLEVYCDMDTDGGGWLVLQRRGNFNRPNDYFFKDWISYKNGFGDIEKDFWLGNDNIFALTNQRLYSIRFDLKAVSGEKRYASYDTFWIDDENNKYTLHIQDYSGDAGDSMISQHNNNKFSTKDQDNDNHESHCASTYKGGWWYNSCHHSNLNGLYLRGTRDGIEWNSWSGYKESMETTEMKIRPKGFRRTTK